MRARVTAAWALATFLALAALAGGPGISRDEAAVLDAASALRGAPSAGPPLAPRLAGVMRAAAAPAGVSSLRAFRLGSALAGALLSALLALLAWELAGPAGALLAPALLWLAPRHLHAGLVATPDVLLAALALATVMAYRRASRAPARRRVPAAALAGLLFGAALATRTDAWILLPALALHALLSRAVALRAGEGPRGVPAGGALALLAMALLGPAILVAAWPGVVRAGGAPWLAPRADLARRIWLVPLLSIPVPLLWAYAAGLAHAAIRLSRVVLRRAPASIAPDELLLLVASTVPFAGAAIASPLPGARPWLYAVPFLALLGARAILSASRLAWPARAAALGAALSLVVLYPGLRAAAHAYPLGASSWNELVGFAPGAASRGLPRQDGGEAAASVLRAIGERAREGARVWWPGTAPGALRAYVRDGRLRPDLRVADGPEDADLAVVTLDGGGRDDEYRAWTAFASARPAAGVYVDEVPLAFVYARAGAWR